MIGYNLLGAENKQGNITANECNDIIHKLSLKSFESEYKVLILWMPEYLGNEGNKLLKLMKSRRSIHLFILVAENESLILPTILSRCQLVKNPLLETKEIEDALISRNKTEPNAARQTASVSERQLPRSIANPAACRGGLAKPFAGLAERSPQNGAGGANQMGGRYQQTGAGKAKAVPALF